MNQLDCDCLVLELPRRSKDEIRHLRDVQPNIQFGIGVVDVKDLQIETPEQVARRIEDIAKILGSERIAYVNPDCGLHILEPFPMENSRHWLLVEISIVVLSTTELEEKHVKRNNLSIRIPYF